MHNGHNVHYVHYVHYVNGYDEMGRDEMRDDLKPAHQYTVQNGELPRSGDTQNLRLIGLKIETRADVTLLT